ncbi:hypothetical protein SteCoe_14282 [Stentor coeruleus]|uniref:Uncharacterized protein n=1 Tax=Stentor coeruleus TaxID=5963 RepID=A0A1R2C6G0_9CILI|nr:hypothetical protein SteCoe_14282 [Stentor coeruleus]
MRASRPEGFTAHGGISNWQFPYGMTLEEILRAGTAPVPEEKTPKRGSVNIVQRTRQPVRAIIMKSNARPKYKHIEQKNSLRFGDCDDDFEEKYDFDDRPPCRQNNNIFDLEDTFHPKFNGFIKENGRSARGEIRPPSRHKTPPKALGLDLPPKRVSGEFISADHMLHQDSPISDPENDSFSNTMPANFSESEKSRKKHFITRESPADPSEGKIRLKPKSAKGAPSEKISMRMWSAAGKPKKKMMEVPIIINKKENSLNFSNSRREKIKNEEDKNDKIIEEKRKTYFKKVAEKRAKSSNNKQKMNMMLPFQTSLEPEFINLFAKSDDFNF